MFPLTQDIPKALLPVGPVPMIVYTLELLERHRFNGPFTTQSTPPTMSIYPSCAEPTFELHDENGCSLDAQT